MLHIERQGRVCTWILDRPECRNAVNRSTADALLAAARAFDLDESLDVAVLTGAGDTFCAGADLVEAAEGIQLNLSVDGPGPLGPTRLRLSKPVIAAIEGHAVAGGLELALWADLRVAAANATLGVFCRRFGVPLIDGGTVRLPQIVGLGRALDLVLTGRAVDAAEALAIGLLNRVVEPGTARAAAEAWAAELSALPQACLRADRASVYGAIDESAALRLEAEGAAALLESATAGARRFRDGHGRGGRAV